MSALSLVLGCGHATVPCPTPTRELDRLREETDQVRTAMERELTVEGALAAKRDAEAQRVLAAEASLDSLSGVERK